MIPIVETRSYELVRDRIAEILANELPNQVTLHNAATPGSGNDLNATVFINRIIPLSNESMPMINVWMGNGDYDNFTQLKQDGTYIYNVDIYTSSPSTSSGSGDVLSMSKLQTLAGVVQGILMHPSYVTLGFERPFIEHREVRSIATGVPNNNLDAHSVTQARLELVVRVPEHSTTHTPNNIAGYDTQVKIGLTDKGYIYSGDNIPIPEPVCDPVTIEQSDGTLIFSAPSGSTYQVADSIVSNSDNTYVENVKATDSLDLPDITVTDSNGIQQSLPAQTDFVCTQIEDSLQWVLNFDPEDNRINVVCDSTNQGQLNFATYDDVGNITYSTDNGETFNPFTVPFTAVSGTTYIFERSDTLNNGSVVLNGLANAVFVFDDSYKDSLIQHLLGGVGVVGSTWLDQSGNGNDAILVNNPTQGADFLRLTKSNSQYVNLNHGASLDEFTISLTVDYVTLTNQDRLLNQITNVSGTWSMYAVNNAFGAPRMEFYTNPAWHNCNFEPFINNKYIIDKTVNNNINEIKVYVDSVLRVTIVDDVNYTDLGIGNRYRGQFGNYLDAEIYEFRLYESVLTQQQITDKNT